ncbi:unnamed protein product [Symbiodinium sp. CCMP2592]|nr:unnamed protein product [Symbiodinium sp. CCMP2592]
MGDSVLAIISGANERKASSARAEEALSTELRTLIDRARLVASFESIMEATHEDVASLRQEGGESLADSVPSLPGTSTLMPTLVLVPLDELRQELIGNGLYEIVSTFMKARESIAAGGTVDEALMGMKIASKADLSAVYGRAFLDGEGQRRVALPFIDFSGETAASAKVAVDLPVLIASFFLEGGAQGDGEDATLLGRYFTAQMAATWRTSDPVRRSFRATGAGQVAVSRLEKKQTGAEIREAVVQIKIKDGTLGRKLQSLMSQALTHGLNADEFGTFVSMTDEEWDTIGIAPAISIAGSAVIVHAGEAEQLFEALLALLPDARSQSEAKRTVIRAIAGVDVSAAGAQAQEPGGGAAPADTASVAATAVKAAVAKAPGALKHIYSMLPTKPRLIIFAGSSGDASITDYEQINEKLKSSGSLADVVINALEPRSATASAALATIMASVLVQGADSGVGSSGKSTIVPSAHFSKFLASAVAIRDPDVATSVELDIVDAIDLAIAREAAGIDPMSGAGDRCFLAAASLAGALFSKQGLAALIVAGAGGKKKRKDAVSDVKIILDSAKKADTERHARSEGGGGAAAGAATRVQSRYSESTASASPGVRPKMPATSRSGRPRPVPRRPSIDEADEGEGGQEVIFTDTARAIRDPYADTEAYITAAVQHLDAPLLQLSRDAFKASGEERIASVGKYYRVRSLLLALVTVAHSEEPGALITAKKVEDKFTRNAILSEACSGMVDMDASSAAFAASAEGLAWAQRVAEIDAAIATADQSQVAAMAEAQADIARNDATIREELSRAGEESELSIIVKREELRAAEAMRQRRTQHEDVINELRARANAGRRAREELMEERAEAVRTNVAVGVTPQTIAGAIAEDAVESEVFTLNRMVRGVVAGPNSAAFLKVTTESTEAMIVGLVRSHIITSGWGYTSAELTNGVVVMAAWSLDIFNSISGETPPVIKNHSAMLGVYRNVAGTETAFAQHAIDGGIKATHRVDPGGTETAKGWGGPLQSRYHAEVIPAMTAIGAMLATYHGTRALTLMDGPLYVLAVLARGSGCEHTARILARMTATNGAFVHAKAGAMVLKGMASILPDCPFKSKSEAAVKRAEAAYVEAYDNRYSRSPVGHFMSGTGSTNAELKLVAGESMSVCIVALKSQRSPLLRRYIEAPSADTFVESHATSIVIEANLVQALSIGISQASRQLATQAVLKGLRVSDQLVQQRTI